MRKTKTHYIVMPNGKWMWRLEIRIDRTTCYTQGHGQYIDNALLSISSIDWSSHVQGTKSIWFQEKENKRNNNKEKKFKTKVIMAHALGIETLLHG